MTRAGVEFRRAAKRTIRHAANEHASERGVGFLDAAISRKVGRAGLRGAHSVHRRSGSCVGPSDDRRPSSSHVRRALDGR